MMKCTNSEDQLAPNQSGGCGSLVSELKNTGKRSLRFKLPANSKPSIKVPFTSHMDTAPSSQPVPPTASFKSPPYPASITTGPPTSSTIAYYPTESFHTTLESPLDLPLGHQRHQQHQVLLMSIHRIRLQHLHMDHLYTRCDTLLHQLLVPR